jgi:hypothetical protein
VEAWVASIEDASDPQRPHTLFLIDTQRKASIDRV